MLLLTALLLQLQSPQLAFTERAALTLDSISALAWRDGLEPGACVTEYEMLKDTIFIKQIGPGQVVIRTSTAVYWGPTVCDDSLPAIHGHLLGIGALTRPSPQDWIMVMQPYRKAPFHLLLLIGAYGETRKLIVYGVK